MTGRFGFWPCCAGEGCGHCTLQSLTWRFSLSGIADDTGSNCTEFNGTHDLTLVDLAPANQSCQLCLALPNNSISILIDTNNFPLITGVTLTLFDNTTCQNDIPIGTGTVAQYLTSGTESCSASSIVLNLSVSDSKCSGWPTSITITAV